MLIGQVPDVGNDLSAYCQYESAADMNTVGIIYQRTLGKMHVTIDIVLHQPMGNIWGAHSNPTFQA